MGLMTFKGGVHPFEGKDLSKDKPIRELLPKGELVYPLSQHIGAPATPIVAVRYRFEGAEDSRSRRLCICTNPCVRIRNC